MPTYINPLIDQEPTSKQLFYVDNKCAIFTCNASPEGVILANTGSIALSDTGAVYKKTTDDVNTGWIELSAVSLPNLYRRIHVNTTPTGNVGAGLDNLHVFNLPGNSLATNQDELDIWYSGSFASNDNDKLLALNYAGSGFINTGTVDVDAGAWTIFVRVLRLTNTSIRCIANINMGYHGATSASVAVGGGVGGIQFSQTADIVVGDLAITPISLTVQATGVADNDIVQNVSSIRLLQQV